MPTYRQAIEAAIASWRGIWLHWNKSPASESAVMILERLMGEERYDDRLKEAVDWFLGNSFVPFNYVYEFNALKTDSALYKKLTAELATADAPILRPPQSPSVVSHVPRPAPVRRRIQSVLPSPPPSSSGASSSSTVVPVVPRAHPAPSPAPVTTARRRDAEAPRELPFARHFAEWAKVEITDIPTGEHGVYESAPEDFQTINQRGGAQMVTQKVHSLGKKDDVKPFPEYWIELGRSISRSKKKVGRCYSCAGVVAHTLVCEREYDNLVIAIVGNPKRDHYFVLVGESMEAISASDGWAIDIWDGNLNKRPPVHPIKQFVYMKGGVKPCCVILPDDRVSLRAFIAERNSGAEL